MMLGKTLLRVLFLSLFALSCTLAYGQTGRGKSKKKKTRSERTNRPEQSNDILDRVWIGGNLTDFSFFNNSFTLGLTPMAAFQLNNIVSIGPFVRMSYRYQRIVDPFGQYSYNAFDVGPGLFARFNVFGDFFAQVEYESAFLAQARTQNGFLVIEDGKVVTEKIQQNYVYVGAGYTSGGPKSKFIVSLHYNVLNDPLTYVRIPWDFRIGMLFNIGPGTGADLNR